MSNFIIEKVEIENFRGYKNKTFEFFSKDKNNPDKTGIILFGGANGFGKTSFFDAVEWCLTGTIKRLFQEHEARSRGTGDGQVKDLKRGLLVNNPSKTAKVVSVKIIGKLNKKDISIKRIFNGTDEFKGISISQEIDKNKTFEIIFDGQSYKSFNDIDDLKDLKLETSFNTSYLCSHDKNIRFYEKSREDITQIFGQCLVGYEQITNAIENIEFFKGKIRDKKASNLIIEREKIEAKIKEFEEKRKTQEDLINKTILDKIPENLLRIEINNINNLDKCEKYEEKIEKIQEVINTFVLVEKILNKVGILDNLKNFYEYLNIKVRNQNFDNEIAEKYSQLKEFIQIAQNEDIDKLNNAKIKHSELITKISNCITSKREEFEGKIKPLLEILSQDENKELLLVDITELINKLIASCKEIQELDNNPDPKIVALNRVDEHLGNLQKIFLDEKKCPLCETSIELIKNQELGGFIKKILKDTSESRLKKIKEFETSQKHINEQIKKYQEILSDFIAKLDKKLDAISKTQLFKKSCIKYNLKFDEINQEIINKQKDKFSQEFVNIKDKESLIDLILDENENILFSNINKNALIQLPNNYLSEIKLLIDNIEREKEKLKDYFYDNQEKKPSLDIIKSQKEYYENKKTLLEFHKNEDEFNKLSIDLEKVKNAIKDIDVILKPIDDKISDLKKIKSDKETEVITKINAPLKAIYQRINRHHNFKGIDLILAGEKKARTKAVMENPDGSNLYAPNVLSAGQISNIAISMFLANALNNKGNNFRCYFMDDPIQTIDDLNIFSFLDLLKIEMNKNNKDKFLDQLFISTCDQDIEKLIEYKMENFGVNIDKKIFKGYAELKNE